MQLGIFGRRHRLAGQAKLLAGVGAGLAGLALWRRMRSGEELRSKVVVITGGSRGLGFALARECGRAGARVVICAREANELQWAREDLAVEGIDVLSVVCDVGNEEDVQRLMRSALERFGQIDVLINNAGIITVGPFPTQRYSDYQECLDVMFWGIVYPTLAVLPHMMRRGEGRIANITSIGGKVSVPHLLPYNCAKFAAVGFSEGLHAEVAKYGIKVTTVVPGLMRTGSFVNAYFKGKHRQEYTWFSLSSALPLLAMQADRAARSIVRAIRQGRAEIILTPQAKLLAMLNGVFPGLTADLLGIANRILPDANGVSGRERHLGKDSETQVSRSAVTAFGRKAGRELHQYAEERFPELRTDTAEPEAEPESA